MALPFLMGHAPSLDANYTFGVNYVCPMIRIGATTLKNEVWAS